MIVRGFARGADGLDIRMPGPKVDSGCARGAETGPKGCARMCGAHLRAPLFFAFVE